MPIEGGDALIVEILTQTFGNEIVNHSLKYRECSKIFSKVNFSLISSAFYPLSYYWQIGIAGKYLESLDSCVQCCLVSLLLENYVKDDVFARNIDAIFVQNWQEISCSFPEVNNLCVCKTDIPHDADEEIEIAELSIRHCGTCSPHSVSRV